MIQSDEHNLILIKYGNDSICISITFMDQSVGLKRELIIKESDVNINYHSVGKKIHKFLSPLTATYT